MSSEAQQLSLQIEQWLAALQPLLGAGPQHKAKRQLLKRQINDAQQTLKATTKCRYPSTPHLPFSPRVNSDDVQLQNEDCRPFFPEGLEKAGVEVVITEKLDGGNCCLREGIVYARTHSKEADHASFGPIKQLYSEMLYEPDFASILMPQRRRKGSRQWQGIAHGKLSLFGENMFGVHSIEYDGLGSFFYLFGVHDDDRQEWWAWDEVVALAHFLGLPPAPVVYRYLISYHSLILSSSSLSGHFQSLAQVRRWMEKQMTAASLMTAHAVDTGDAPAPAPAPAPAGVVRPEGFVLRIADRYRDQDFSRSIAKYVRAGHNQTPDSWSRTWGKASLYSAAVAQLQMQRQEYEQEQQHQADEKKEETTPPPPPLARQLSDEGRSLLQAAIAST